MNVGRSTAISNRNRFISNCQCGDGGGILPRLNFCRRKSLSGHRLIKFSGENFYSGVRIPTKALPELSPKFDYVKFLLRYSLYKIRTFFESNPDEEIWNNADEVLRKLFSGERIPQNFGWFLFSEFGCRKRRRRGLGRNPPLAPLFVLAKFGRASRELKSWYHLLYYLPF